MPNPQGKPIFFVEEGGKERDAAHRIYARLNFLKKDYRLVTKVPPGGVLADIGCGDGAFLKRARMIRSNVKLAGVDLADYLEFIPASQLDSFVFGDLAKGIPLASESVDYLHCCQVIEHLQDPSLLMKEIYRVLKKGGFAYLEAPAPITLFMPSIGTVGTFNFHDDVTHVHPYTKESFRKLALQSGFSAKGIRVFCARSGFNLLFFPYTFFRFLCTRHNYYIQSCLQPILGLDTGGVFVKDM